MLLPRICFDWHNCHGHGAITHLLNICMYTYLIFLNVNGPSHSPVLQGLWEPIRSGFQWILTNDTFVWGKRGKSLAGTLTDSFLIKPFSLYLLPRGLLLFLLPYLSTYHILHQALHSIELLWDVCGMTSAPVTLAQSPHPRLLRLVAVSKAITVF